MLMFGPIAYQVALFLRPHLSPLKYRLLLLFPITATMTVIGASSRGAQLGLVYQLYRALLKGKLSLRALMLSAIVIGAAFALLPDEQKERFSSAGKDDTSTQRLLYWKRGIEMIETHPVLGVGFYNFAPYFRDHYPQDMLRGAAQLPHNIFVQVGTDSGLLGLGTFLALLYRNFRCCHEIRRLTASAGRDGTFASSVAKGLVIALWGYIIAGQFVTITYYPFFWVNLAMSVALLNVVRRDLAQADSSKP
jgi:O-antigen ligase